MLSASAILNNFAETADNLNSAFITADASRHSAVGKDAIETDDRSVYASPDTLAVWHGRPGNLHRSFPMIQMEVIQTIHSLSLSTITLFFPKGTAAIWNVAQMPEVLTWFPSCQRLQMLLNGVFGESPAARSRLCSNANLRNAGITAG